LNRPCYSSLLRGETHTAFIRVHPCGAVGGCGGAVQKDSPALKGGEYTRIAFIFVEGDWCVSFLSLIHFLEILHAPYQTTLAHEPCPQNKDDAMMEDAINDVEGWQCNCRRKLWKTACTRAALNVRSLLISFPASRR
jgi:hypothetical protein